VGVFGSAHVGEFDRTLLRAPAVTVEMLGHIVTVRVFGIDCPEKNYTGMFGSPVMLWCEVILCGHGRVYLRCNEGWAKVGRFWTATTEGIRSSAVEAADQREFRRGALGANSLVHNIYRISNIYTI
jgi:hypothetical protein